MEPADLRELLEQVRAGGLGIEAALEKLGTPGVADLGYAHVDLHRQVRCGFPEVIFCEGKTPDWIEGVARQLLAAGQNCLATRVSEEQAARLAASFPHAQQDRIARIFWLPAVPPAAPACPGVILTPSTIDLP